MHELIDHLIAALIAQRDRNEPAAAENYLKALPFAVKNRDYDVQVIAAFAKRFLSEHHNASDVWVTNGEFTVLERLASFQPKVIFDVGAQHGYWSERALKSVPSTTAVHAFEILPQTAEYLKERLKDYDNLFVNVFGLFDKEGEVTVRYAQDKNFNYLTSAVSQNAGLTEEAKLPVRVGDAYRRENGIDRINFLKIDVEGCEANVLRGFSEAFSERAIDVVQFEYGKICLDSRFLLKDFYQFFSRYDFKVGLLYPDGVLFREYSWEHENFLGTNFIACRADCPHLLEALKQQP